jgi:predicted cupin superfamily sugar epimerase
MTVPHDAARLLIDRLGLTAHPEGGYYRETHRDAAHVARLGADGAALGAPPRCASTAIYYLLADGAYSAWHRIDADELWHFYAGNPLDIHMLDEAGQLTIQRLGNALVHADAAFQVRVPAGCWFAAECVRSTDESASFALVGCTVAPGFEFSAFELADTPALVAAHPSHAALLQRLAPGGPRPATAS